MNEDHLGKFSLLCHPATPPLHVRGVQVVWRAEAGGVRLRWEIARAESVVMPRAAGRHARADGLWKHTCFELFLASDGAPYRECNFSPSQDWAAYRFAAYREGMAEAPMPAPAIRSSAGAEDGVAARCEVDLASGVLAGASKAGLCAVIEERGGHLSYWALHHPAAKPDFHDSAGFTLAIAAAEAP